MNGTRQAEEGKSEKNDDDNAEKLKRLTLNEENKASSKDKCTPTLDYLQVFTINGNINYTQLPCCTYFSFYYYSISLVYSLLLKSCISFTKIHLKTVPKRFLTTKHYLLKRSIK